MGAALYDKREARAGRGVRGRRAWSQEAPRLKRKPWGGGQPCPARLSDPGASARVRVTCERGRGEDPFWEFSFNFLTRFDVKFLETLT